MSESLSDSKPALDIVNRLAVLDKLKVKQKERERERETSKNAVVLQSEAEHISKHSKRDLIFQPLEKETKKSHHDSEHLKMPPPRRSPRLVMTGSKHSDIVPNNVKILR